MSAEYIEYLNAIVQDLYQKGLDLPIQFKERKGIDFDVSLSALQGFLEFNEMLAYAESGFYVNILDYETPLTFAERLRKSSTKEFAQRLQEERELDELIEDITKADSSEYKFSVDSSAEDAVVFVDTEDMNTEQAGEFIEQHNLPEYTEVGSNAAEMFTEMLGLEEDEDAEGIEEDSTEEEEDYVDENGVHHSRYSSRFNDIDDSKLYADEIAEKRAYQAEVEEEVLSLDEEYTGDTDIEVEEEVLDVSGTDTESTETEGNDIDDYLLDDAEETSEGAETYPETNTEPPESVSEDFEGNDTPEEDNALESLVAPSEGEDFSEQETAEDFVHSERLPSTGVEGVTQDLGITESTTSENDNGTSGVEGVTQGEDSENIASLDEISFDSEEDGDTFEVEGGFLQSGESVDTFMCHSHSSDETDNGSDKNKFTNTEETNGDNLFFDSEDDFDFNFGADEEDEEDSLGDESDYSGVTETPQGGINYRQNEYNAIGADTRDTDEKIADFLVSLITKSTNSLKNLFSRFGSES